MSERDSGHFGCAMVVISIFVVIIILWLRADYHDIRDLQRRVGQLEQQRR